jgi:hypothetical protein
MMDDILKRLKDTLTTANKAALADIFMADADKFRMALLDILDIVHDPLGTPGQHITDGARLVKVGRVATEALKISTRRDVP